MNTFHAHWLLWLALALLLLGALLSLVLARPAGGQADYHLVMWTVGGGLRVDDASSGASLTGQIGEPGVGVTLSGGRYTLTPGVLAARIAQVAQTVRLFFPLLSRDAEP